MLIGRDEECARLSEQLGAARAGTGGALVLVGEPGIGKTTLLNWASTQAGGGTVVAARGIESEAELPYATLVDLLTPLAHRLDALPATQAEVLAAAIGLGPPRGIDRFAVGVATLGLLAAVAEDGPLLVLVDDLQWIDAASCDALAFAGRRLATIPVLVLATQRMSAMHTDVRLPSASYLRVEPLGADDSARLLGGGIAPAVAARLLDAARGNPLALVELPRLLTEQQLAGVDPVLDPIPTSNGLERAFAARLAPLSGDARQAMLVAAADGSGTAAVVLRALAALGLGEEALHEPEALGLISLGANEIEFRHPLVRSAAYQAGDPADKRVAHAALADAESDPDRALWHRVAAAVGPDEALADSLAESGKRAAARGAFGAAATTFERAAALSVAGELRGERLLSASVAHDQLGNLARSEALAREAEGLIEDPVRRARAVAHVASVKMAQGDVEVASRLIVDEAQSIAEADPLWAAAMMSLALNLPLHRLEAAKALELAERARALGEPTRSRMHVEQMGLGLSKILSGDADGRAIALRLAQEARSLGVEGYRQASGVGWGLVWVEEYEAARTLLSWAATVQREGGALRYLAQSLHPLGELDYRVGRWVSALAQSYEAIDLYVETGQRAELAFACGTVARVEAACGKDAECRAHARIALDVDAETGMTIAGGYANAALGLLALGQGDPEAAMLPLEQVEQLARAGELREPWIIHWAPDLVEACQRGGHTERALEVLEEFEAQAVATGRVSALAAAARCRGMLADGDEYHEAFASALERHAEVRSPFEQARTELVYGERLRRDGQRAEARTRLQNALEAFETLRAHPWAERTRVELRASGQTVLSAEQRMNDDLTPQELQVAALVAGGATNREAAAALFLSGKTIEFHLGNVYKKLGIRSRTELARVIA